MIETGFPAPLEGGQKSRGLSGLVGLLLKPKRHAAICQRRRFISILLAPVGALALAAPSTAEEPAGSDQKALLEQFQNPPHSSRPRVWWHWVNGNISEDGIERDLEWLASIGVGGAQIFDVARPMPSIVDTETPYMSPAWRRAFRTAVRKADKLGLELGIASSPGWSETGAHWVPPEDAMKKLVWSSTDIKGGLPFAGVLPMPPDSSGPFQELKGDAHHGTMSIRYYRDSLVMAVPLSQKDIPVHATIALVNGEQADANFLQDDNLISGIGLPGSSSEAPGSLEYVFPSNVTIRSARLYIANPPHSIFAGPLVPRLEASDDGQVWQTIDTFPLTDVPSTISFPPVSARHFRMVLARGNPQPINFSTAPGVDLRLAGGLGGTPEKAVLAEFNLYPEARIDAFEQKAAYAYADDYYDLDARADDGTRGIAPGSVIDLSDNMTAGGRLDWTPPEGDWRILRIGYSLTGKTNAPATPQATGLEVDKYDRGAVERYLDRYLQDHRKITGAALFGQSGLTELVNDSIEVRPANWTPGIISRFEELRGYDPRPWLPALTGILVGSRTQSDAFLYDFRRTLGELIETEHYGTIVRVARREGLTVYTEALEGNRSISALGDDLDLRRHADIPMGAMWSFKAPDPAPHYRADMRGAASVAHLYGKPFVAAEVLTSILQPWAYSPADLQPMIDAAFLAGVNRPVIHSVVHQPRDDRQPGMSLQGFGQFFGRHESWAELAKPWMDYIARTSFLLQQGTNVADVAYFYGEETPISVIAAKGFPSDVPQRHAYDFISAEGLRELSVEDGELVSSGGARYRALYLGGTSDQMTLPVLKRLSSLAEGGATIIGLAPSRSPSLADDRSEFDSYVRKMWSGKDSAGRVIATQDVEGALAEIGVLPDFRIITGTDGADIRFAHRRSPESEIYLLSNRKPNAAQIDAHFRVSGRVPYIWRADTGSVSTVSFRSDDVHTVIPLTMQPNESLFVVFAESTSEAARSVAKPEFRSIGALNAGWTVSFEPGRGAPSAKLQLDKLDSFTESDLPGVKYFSGLATYETEFVLPEGAAPGRTLFLDLGEVGDIAEVTVNGERAGTAWKAPYQIEIGNAVKAGTNHLRIRVANLWVNRLIGDQQPGAEKITSTAIPTYTQSAPLRKSGLIGPVTLFVEDRTE